MIFSIYNSYYEINLRRIRENIQKIRAYHKNVDIMPVLKSNAYGMGTAKIASYIYNNCGINVMACAQVCEGIQIRRAGVDCPILVLGPVPDNAKSYAVENDLMPPVFTPEIAKKFQEEAELQHKSIDVQIKIESGMNRIGVRIGEDLEKLLDVISACPNLNVVGAYTHFVQADIIEDPFCHQQFDIFKKAAAQIEARGIKLKYKHICNTSASEWYQQAVDFSTHIRVGSLFLGYSDITDRSNPINVREVLSWRASITAINTVKKGETAGYDRYFKPDKDTRIAIAGVGFGDGLSNVKAKHGGPVYVNETLTHYVDTCMDQCFIDVTGIDCKIGDTVTIFGYTPKGKLLSPKDFSSKYGEIYTGYTCVGGLRAGTVYLE